MLGILANKELSISLLHLKNLLEEDYILILLPTILIIVSHKPIGCPDYMVSPQQIKQPLKIFNTKLVNVEYKLGINGWIHPIIEFEPHTFDDGVTVSRFELSHTLDIRKFKLGIGDELIMYRSGGNIVKMVDNITKSDTIPTPIRCPFCNIYTTKKNEDMFCNYRFCREVKLKKFAHFIRAMDIKIGVETIKKLKFQ